jgi:hypothetical protein
MCGGGVLHVDMFAHNKSAIAYRTIAADCSELHAHMHGAVGSCMLACALACTHTLRCASASGDAMRRAPLLLWQTDCCTAPCCAMLCCMYRAMLCHAVLSVPCHAVPCYAVLSGCSQVCLCLRSWNMPRPVERASTLSTLVAPSHATPTT